MFSYLNPLPQLPKYKGPYKVGSCEYEIPVSEITSPTNAPDGSITTIKFRVFYPTTDSASSKTSIPWLPRPQKEWNRAYANFLGFSERSSNFVANAPSMLSHPSLPAVYNAPLLESPNGAPFPVVVFSHGLGGNYNAYSSFVGSLASCGSIVFAPEHRDQSAPVTLIRSSKEDKTGRPLLYRKVSHSPRVDVLNARNDMLRVRLWEMEKLFATITGMHEGKAFTNYAADAKEMFPAFQDRLNLADGKVTWSGHSFGAATIVQFVKSVYYRQFAPDAKTKDNEGWDWRSLYTPAENDVLTHQITPKSPLVLLDLWTMPLTSKTTKWLWEKPLPCYDREKTASSDGDGSAPNVISIMSSQFHKWSEMLNRTKALLSADPVGTYHMLTTSADASDSEGTKDATADKTHDPQISLVDPITKLETSKTSGAPSYHDQSTEASKPASLSLPGIDGGSESSTRTPSPTRSDLSASSTPATTNQSEQPSTLAAKEVLNTASSSVSSLNSVPQISTQLVPSTTSIAPLLFLVPTSAHLSQSDFGLLFPNVTKWLLKTIEPQLIMDLNVRAATAVMKGCGLNVQDLKAENKSTSKKSQKMVQAVHDRILHGDGDGAAEEVWKRIDIST